MPLNYNVTYGSNTYRVWDCIDLRTPYRWRQPRKEYIVEGNSFIYNLVEEYVQLIEYYTPLQPAARHPEFSNLFFVKDSPIQDVGQMAIGKFSRTWAVLPGYGDKGYIRSEYESYSYTVPAFDTAQTSFYQFPVASAVLVNGNYVITVTLAAPPFDALDVATGDAATIHYMFTDAKTGQSSTKTIFRRAISASSNQIVVPYFGDSGTVQIIGVSRADLNQPSYTKQVMSRIDYDYWIPGVNCDSVSAIPIIEELRIVNNNTGGRTDILSDLEETTPSIDDWMDYVTSGTWFVVEPSVVRRWQGEIYERATRYIRYTM